MTAGYFDSSAIVKLYANELHHELVRGFEGVLICSSLTRVEVAAALSGKVRSGEISNATAQVVHDVFIADWSDGKFVVVPPDESIETEAARLASVYAVRGFDALHLATAKAVRSAVPEINLFASFDKRLNLAAASEQFQLLPAA